MFERTIVNDSNNISLGRIHPYLADSHKRYQLLLALVACNAEPGRVLQPGDHELESASGEKNRWKFTLTHLVTYRGMINTVNTTVDELKLFNQFLQKIEDEDKDFIKADSYFLPYPDHRSNQFELFLINGNFKHRISNDGIEYFDVFHAQQEVHAKGAFGSIYSIAGTIKPEHSVFGELVFSGGLLKRVSKVQYDTLPRQASRITREAKIMQKVGIYNIRDVSYLKEEIYFSMRYFHGWSLENFFDSNGVKELLITNALGQQSVLEKSLFVTVPARLFVVDGMLTSLLYDFHKKKVVHCDIKPPNVHLELDSISNACKARILDTGLSYHEDDSEMVKEERRFDVIGTPIYLSPAALSGYLLAREDDVYAAAITIAMIFGDTKCDSYNNYNQMKKDRINSESAPLELFNNISTYSSIEKQIQEILRDMTLKNKCDRISLTEAIMRFRVLVLDYFKLLQIDERRGGMLGDIEMTDNIQIGFNYGCGMKLRAYLEICAASIGNQENLKRFYNELTATVEKLHDQPIAIKAFSHALGESSLMNCASKKELQSRIHHHYQEYRLKLVEFLESYCKLHALKKTTHLSDKSANELTCYLKYADRSRQKCTRFHCTFEDMVNLTKYMQEKTVKFKRAFGHFCTVQPAAAISIQPNL